jgi:hypothetical protein
LGRLSGIDGTSEESCEADLARSVRLLSVERVGTVAASFGVASGRDKGSDLGGILFKDGSTLTVFKSVGVLEVLMALRSVEIQNNES